MQTTEYELRQGAREFVDELNRDNAETPPTFETVVAGRNYARIKALAWVGSAARVAEWPDHPDDDPATQRDRYRETLREIAAIVAAALGRPVVAEGPVAVQQPGRGAS